MIKVVFSITEEKFQKDLGKIGSLPNTLDQIKFQLDCFKH